MEMKEYKTPEMEVVELKYQTALLAGSNGENAGTDPNDNWNNNPPVIDE